jgi:tetratricopeptide (TPR) repeat protein
MATGATSEQVRRLRRSVEWAMRQPLAPEEIVAMLRRLADAAPRESEAFGFAHRHLAELSVETQPWTAALSARHALSFRPEDDGAWAVLGLSFTLLGHYRTAVAAYRQALALAPANPWYAHNLGHLLDVALNRPVDAVKLLERAHRKEPREPEIAASCAHAMGRVGRIDEARTLLRKFLKDGGSSDHKALMRWLDRGAPPIGSSSPRMDRTQQDPAAAKSCARTAGRRRSSKRARSN